MFTQRKVQGGFAAERLDVGIASGLEAMGNVTGWVEFVPEYWWRRREEWAARTQRLPGLEQHQRTFQFGWNKKIAERRPEVAKLIQALGGMR